jgi:dodecin
MTWAKFPQELLRSNAYAWARPGIFSSSRGSDRALTKEATMSVARVTEISSSSTKSFEDAVNNGISRATKTLRGVSGAWVKEHKITIKNDKVVSYQVNMMVTFVLDD